MEELTPKENKARIEFLCDSKNEQDCAYFRSDKKIPLVCCCRDYTLCKSRVAHVNALTLELKRITGE